MTLHLPKSMGSMDQAPEMERRRNMTLRYLHKSTRMNSIITSRDHKTAKIQKLHSLILKIWKIINLDEAEITRGSSLHTYFPINRIRGDMNQTARSKDHQIKQTSRIFSSYKKWKSRIKLNKTSTMIRMNTLHRVII